MEFKVVECDFIRRTLYIIDQYDNLVMASVSKDKQFEVSLLINCLTSLLVLPFEHQKRIQNGVPFPVICKGDDVSYKNLDAGWGLQQLDIKKFVLNGIGVSPDQTTLRQIVAMMRHSIAHGLFGDGNTMRKPNGISVTYSDYTTSYVPDLKSQIKEVHFVNKYQKTYFEATIPVIDLKLFAKKLANSVLVDMQCK